MVHKLKHIKIIGFDADDTLWVNEPHYREAERNFCGILSEYLPKKQILKKLFDREMKNLDLYGYGAKSFLLSMIETALEITDKKITGAEIQKIIDSVRKLLNEPIELLDDVEKVLKTLHSHYELIIITKGDLLDQERKLKKSGLTPYFHHIEIVSNKNEDVYSGIINKLEIQPEEFLMIGNSLKSDILPTVHIGACAIHIPYHTTWEHELVEEHQIINKKYFRVNTMEEILLLLKKD